jgi:hypothetical protein
MTLGNWRKCPLRDWNEVLVDAVFEKRPRASRPIDWIDVTPKFLASAVGASSNEGEDVLQAFLARFREFDGYLFRLSAIPRGWDSKSPELPFFSHLYLSLLAASSAEDTHDEGNFRNRLGIMLNSQSSAMYEPLELATLWEKAKEWSVRTARPRTRELVLPKDVGSETRIGYSKRLAFPGYKDFNALAYALAQEGVSGRSPAEKVTKAIAKYSHKFSDRFVAEFRTFKSFVSSGDRARTVASPLWSAVEAADWGRLDDDGEEKESATFQLELVLADLGAPELLLLFKGESLGRVQGWAQRPLLRPVSGYDKMFLPEETVGDAVCNPVERLSGDLVARQAVQRFDANFVSRLRDGILVFAQDDLNRWVETTSLTDVPKYWLVCDGTRSELVKRVERQINGQDAIQVPLQGSAAWSVFGPLTSSVALREKFEKLFPRQPAFQSYIRPPSVRLFDTIRLSTGVFFRWPILPIARCEDAARISCQATVGSDGDYPPFDLEPLDGTSHRNIPFGFPKEHAQKIEGHTRIVLQAYSADEDDPAAQASYELVSECADCDISGVDDLESWLVEGPAGQLVSAADVPVKSTVALGERARGPEWRPLLKSRASALGPQWILPTEPSKEWEIFIDGLCGKFGQRVQLGPEDLRELVARVWGGSFGKNWSKIEDLVQNGWVRRLYRRRWRGNVYVGCSPKLFITRERARLVGLLPSGKRRELLNYCKARGLACRQARDARTDIYGAIEIPGLSANQAHDVTTLLGIPDPDTAETKGLTLPGWDKIFAQSASEAKNGKIDYWRPGKGWSESSSGSAAKVPTLTRHRFERRQDRYALEDGEIEWFTDSRSWALLARAAAAGEIIGSFDKSGCVTLQSQELALPAPIGHLSLIRGGGLCFRNAVDNLVYSASDDWAPVDALASWKASDTPRPHSDRNPALQRWHFALEYTKRTGRAAAPRPAGGQS